MIKGMGIKQRNYKIFAQNIDITHLVNIMGGGAFEKAEEVFRKVEGRGPAEDKNLDLLRQYDPFNILKEAPLRDTLLIHGTSDNVVPIEIQRYFYEEFLSLYQAQNKELKFIEMNGIGHFTTLWMIEEVINWIIERNIT